METVTLKPLFHKGTECIAIYSIQNATLNHYFQKKAGAKWSRTNKCWYVPCTEKNYELLWLGVWEHNEKAKAFYKKWDFTDTGNKHDFPIGSTPQTDHWLMKFIKN